MHKYWQYNTLGTYTYAKLTGSTITGYRDFTQSEVLNKLSELAASINPGGSWLS